MADKQYVYTGDAPMVAQLPDGTTKTVAPNGVVKESEWGDVSGRSDFKPKPAGRKGKTG